jgi:hypothetical protein
LKKELDLVEIAQALEVSKLLPHEPIPVAEPPASRSAVGPRDIRLWKASKTQELLERLLCTRNIAAGGEPVVRILAHSGTEHLPERERVEPVEQVPTLQRVTAVRVGVETPATPFNQFLLERHLWSSSKTQSLASSGSAPA